MISDKWKVLILRDLLDGTKRFSELRRSVGSVSQKVLTWDGKTAAGAQMFGRQCVAEGADGESASDGARWIGASRGVSGSAAARGVFADGNRADAATDYRGDEGLGHAVQG